MHFDEKKLTEILLAGNYITEDDIKKAAKYAKSHNCSLTEYLTREELLTKDLLGQAIAESFKVPYSDLNSNPPLREQVLKMPEELAKKLRVVLVSQNKKK